MTNGPDCQHDRAIPSLDHARWGGWYCPDCRKGCGKPGQYTAAPPRETLGLPPLLVKSRPAAPPNLAEEPDPKPAPVATSTDPRRRRPWEKWLSDPPVPGGAAPPLAPGDGEDLALVAEGDRSRECDRTQIAPPAPGQLTNSPLPPTPAPGQLTNSLPESGPPFLGIPPRSGEKVCKRFVKCQDWEKSVSEIKSGWHPQGVYIVPSKGRRYFRYIVVEGSRHIINKHIPGGNVDNPLAQERAAQVEQAIANGAKPAEVANMIASWTTRQRRATH